MAESETGPPVHQFFVYAPDKTDERCLARRLAVRQQHLANVRALNAAGGEVSVKLGRGLLSEESLLPDAEQRMIGSVLVYQASSLEAVRHVVESDIYYTEGVWDPERIVILPFFGLPLPTSASVSFI